MRLQYLQEACKEAGIPVPIDDLLEGRPCVSLPVSTTQDKGKLVAGGDSAGARVTRGQEDLMGEDLDKELTPEQVGEYIGRRISIFIVTLVVFWYIQHSSISSSKTSIHDS